MAMTITALETPAVRALLIAAMSHLLTRLLRMISRPVWTYSRMRRASSPAHAWHRFRNMHQATPLPRTRGLARGTNAEIKANASAAGLLEPGTRVTENHPIVGARIKQAALRGTRLVVIDPRRDETTGTPEYKVTAVRIETMRS
jgi:hypothetical protein